MRVESTPSSASSRPRGVDDVEPQRAKPRRAHAPVARDARPVVDERELLAHQPVEQGRLADVGPADAIAIVAVISPRGPSRSASRPPADARGRLAVDDDRVEMALRLRSVAGLEGGDRDQLVGHMAEGVRAGRGAAAAAARPRPAARESTATTPARRRAMSRTAAGAAASAASASKARIPAAASRRASSEAVRNCASSLYPACPRRDGRELGVRLLGLAVGQPRQRRLEARAGFRGRLLLAPLVEPVARDAQHQQRRGPMTSQP